MTPEHIRRILDWPAETWSDDERRQVREHRTTLHAEQVALADQAERERRDLTADEAEQFDRLQAEFDRLGGGIPAQR